MAWTNPFGEIGSTLILACSFLLMLFINGTSSFLTILLNGRSNGSGQKNWTAAYQFYSRALVFDISGMASLASNSIQERRRRTCNGFS